MIKPEFPETLPCGRWSTPAWLSCLALGLLSVWFLVVLVVGARLAYLSASSALFALTSSQPSSQSGASLAATIQPQAEPYAAAALAVYAVIVLVVMLCQIFRPRLTLALAVLAPAAIFTLAAIARDSMGSILAAGVFIVTSWTAGGLALRVVGPPATSLPWTAEASLRVALGMGCLGTAILILGAFNGIASVPVLFLTAVVNTFWVALNRHRSNGRRFDAISLQALPQVTWFEALLVAMTGAFFVFAALATLTPESILTASDSVRQHLPQAREIWQDHAVLVYPTIETPSASVLGAALNAVAYGIDGVTSVRIFQVAVSLCGLIAIAGLGEMLGGRVAGITSAAVFSTMPIVLWLTGHVYPDLLAVLFVCTSVLCVLCWQNDGRVSWLLIAGVLSGFSLATKQISAVLVMALVVSLAVTARPGVTIAQRGKVFAIFAAACAISTFPWFIRSALLTGRIPLVGTLLGQIASVLGIQLDNDWLLATVGPVTTMSAPPAGTGGGVARSLLGLASGPWDLTFNGAIANYRSVRYGEFGILLLMFLPLVLLRLCSRAVLLVGITTLISYLGWVFTIQVPRHLLPSLALLAVLAGTAVSAVTRPRLTAIENGFSRLVQGTALAGLALTPLFFLPNLSTSFPVNVITGVTSPEQYLTGVDPAISALSAATTLLPPDTKLGYIGQWQGDQSATEARLIYLGQYSANDADTLDSQVGDSPEAIFRSFNKWGIQYFIWDRPDTRPQDVESLLLSGDFLLRYTTILGGDNGVYLFALHPDGAVDPTLQKNLLQDPAFASLGKSDNVWNGSKRDLNKSGGLQPRRQMPVAQRVAVEPGIPYLLVLTGSCNSNEDQTRVSLQWLDAGENIISNTADYLASGTRTNSTLMWRTAPQNAAAVEVSISTASGDACQIKKIGMYAYGTK